MRIFMAGLCLVLVDCALGALDDRASAKKERGAVTESRYTTIHVRMTSDKRFADVLESLERQLGKFDPQVYKLVAESGSKEAARAKLESMAGSSGFMLFEKRDHGTLLNLTGQKRQAVQYVLGNPLFAIEMTKHAIGASLYAPLRLLVYVADDGKTWIEYDRPTSLFGQFGNEQVDRMATTLDQTLERLATTALH
jgi:uncharacterized protein (DUF302 family)